MPEATEPSTYPWKAFGYGWLAGSVLPSLLFLFCKPSASFRISDSSALQFVYNITVFLTAGLIELLREETMVDASSYLWPMIFLALCLGLVGIAIFVDKRRDKRSLFWCGFACASFWHGIAAWIALLTIVAIATSK